MNIALLVATVDRKESVVRLLNSLGQQTFRNFTVYIGDQNSSPILQDIIDYFRSQINIIHCPISRQGLSAVRNILLEKALSHKKYDWIAFPDDDCWYEPDTLKNLSLFSRRYPKISGILCSQKDENGIFRYSKPKDINRFNAFFASETYVQFYRVSAISCIGNFDVQLGPGTGLPYGCGEDTDYVLRALKSGIKIVRESSIVVCHPKPRIQDNKYIKKWQTYGYGRIYLLRKHKFPKWFIIANIFYPLAKALTEGSTSWNYRKNMFLGRWYGLWKCTTYIEENPAMNQYNSLQRLIDKLYPLHVSARDEILLKCVFANNVNQPMLDDCLEKCDIEVMGGAKCLLLSYLMHEHPELKFSSYSGPRIRGLINFWRFRNLKTLSHFSKIGKALNANRIPMLLFKGGAMKLLRPELSRSMGDVDILIPQDRIDEAVRLCANLGFLYDRADSKHAIGFHTPTEDAVDIHYALYEPGTDLRTLHDRLFSRAASRKAFGVDVLLPCHEDLFFLVLANFTKNLREHTSLKGLYLALCDCHFLLRDKPDFRWEIVREDAKNSDKELEVRFAAEFMNRIVPETIPLEKLGIPISTSMEAFCNQVIFDEDIFLQRQKECQAIRVVELKNHPWREGIRIGKFLILKQIRKHPWFVKQYLLFIERRMKNAH